MEDATSTPTTQKEPAAATPWERLPDETDKDFAAFNAYLRMPAPRSARQLARATGQAARSLDRLVRRNRWVERASAWDSMRIQQAMATVPMESENPYQRMLFQAATRAQALHDAAALLLSQAHRKLEWSERQFQKELAKSGASVDIEPPVPPPNIVAAIRGASEVMDKCAEAQALALGITDVMKMQAQGGGGQ